MQLRYVLYLGRLAVALVKLSHTSDVVLYPSWAQGQKPEDADWGAFDPLH